MLNPDTCSVRGVMTPWVFQRTHATEVEPEGFDSKLRSAFVFLGASMRLIELCG